MSETMNPSETLNRVQEVLDRIDEKAKASGIHIMDGWEATLNLEPVGLAFDRADPRTYSDLQVIQMAKKYQDKLLNADQIMREAENAVEALESAFNRGEFSTRRERERYNRLVTNARNRQKNIEQGRRYLRRERDTWRNEANRRASLQEPRQPFPIGSAFEYYTDDGDIQDAGRDIEQEIREGYGGIDSIESIRAMFEESKTPDSTLAIGAMPTLNRDKRRVLEGYRRAVRVARVDLNKKQKQRSQVKNILKDKNLSQEKRREAEELLSDLEMAVGKRMDEIRFLRTYIKNTLHQSASSSRLRRFRGSKKSRLADRLPSVPQHAIGNRPWFYPDGIVPDGYDNDDDDGYDDGYDDGDDYDDGNWSDDNNDNDENDRSAAMTIGVNLSPSKLKSSLKDKKRGYKERLTKMGQKSWRPSMPKRGGDLEGTTVRKRESQERKAANKRVSDLKKDKKRQEKQRKKGRSQQETAARKRRQSMVRGARKEESSARKGVQKRRSAATREAKKEFDAARKRFRAKTQQAKRGASKELKSLRQQRQRKAREGRVSERRERSQARKTFGRPDKTFKKRIRGAEKDKKRVVSKRDRRIKQEDRMEKWQDRLQGLVDKPPEQPVGQEFDDDYDNCDYEPSGYDIALGLYTAAECAMCDPESGETNEAEDYAVDSIMAHLPYEMDQDEDGDMRTMVGGYVGAWVSSAIGEECCDATRELGLTPSDVRDILDLHAQDIADKIEADCEDADLAETWLDFHHTNARLIDDDIMDRTMDEYDAEDGDHSLLAKQLFSGANGDSDDDDEMAQYDAQRYRDPDQYQYLAPPRRSYMPPRPMRYNATHNLASRDPRGETAYSGWTDRDVRGLRLRFFHTPDHLYDDTATEHQLQGQMRPPNPPGRE